MWHGIPEQHGVIVRRGPGVNPLEPDFWCHKPVPESLEVDAERVVLAREEHGVVVGKPEGVGRVVDAWKSVGLNQVSGDAGN